MAVDLEAAREKPALSDKDSHDQASSEPEHAVPEPVTKSNVVDWDGPDDPKNPQNWPSWKRLIQVIFASAFLLTAYQISHGQLVE